MKTRNTLRADLKQHERQRGRERVIEEAKYRRTTAQSIRSAETTSHKYRKSEDQRAERHTRKIRARVHVFLLCAVFRQTPHHHNAHVYRDRAGRIVTPIPVPVLAAILIYRALAEFCVALLHPPWCAFVVYNNNTTTNNSSAGSHTHTLAIWIRSK